jgi:tellurite resistance protein TerC
LTTGSGLWILFGVLVAAALAVDLLVVNARAHRMTVREAAKWVTLWVGLAAVFNVALYYRLGSQPALEFLAAYLVEYSLSVDNLFVFLMIFSYFQVPADYQHRVLFWGILGAILIRGAFIAAGVALFEAFRWIPYVFGAFLVYTGIAMAFKPDREMDLEANPVLRMARKLLPMTDTYEREFFLVRRAGRLMFTPLVAVLLMLETTDVVFAVDSIPAVFGVTRNPLIVYTSNIFAILGLRSLFFLLAGIMGLFRYLKYGLSAILSFVGLKMLLAGVIHIPILLSLGIIIGVLAVSVLASILIPARGGKSAHR